MVYDVTSGESFANVKRWLHEIEQNCDVVNRILGISDALLLLFRLSIYVICKQVIWAYIKVVTLLRILFASAVQERYLNVVHILLQLINH